MFYALSIIILMVKYIRRERQEAEIDSYYFEFVTREKFQTPQFVNTQKMCNILKSVQYTKVYDEDDTVIDEGESITHKPKNETIV
jgi:UDP-N-acetyl-D-mannosaminuronic acid transferase (WecB/TagA/CpsF family)